LSTAVEARHDDAAARAAIGLTEETGLRQSRFDEAERWAVLSEAQVGHLSRKDELLGLLLSRRSQLRRSQARYDEALADATRALEIQRRVLGEDHPSVAETWSSLAGIQRFRARYPEALAAYSRCVAISQRTVGPDHPLTVVPLIGIADVHGESGEHDRAIAEYRAALATLLRIQPDHPLVAVIHNDIGTELLAVGRAQEAFDQLLRAQELWDKRLGPSQETTIGYNNLGETKLGLEQPEEALKYLMQGLEQCGRNLGSDHLCGVILRNLGEAYRKLGRAEPALGSFQKSLATLEKALGGKHPALAATLLGMGRVELGRHDLAGARTALERALAISEAQPGDGIEVADIRFALAQVRWQSGDRDAARTLVTQAQAAYAKDATQRKPLAEATAWLEHHR
jgi:tetratricopeptide (TPR) repeat protein